MKTRKDMIKGIINGKLEWTEDNNVLIMKICNANITMVFYSKHINLIIDKKVNNEYSNKPEVILNESEQLEIYERLRLDIIDNTICEYILHNRNNNTITITYDAKNQCKISSISISNERYDNKDFVPIESILVSSIINYLLID